MTVDITTRAEWEPGATLAAIEELDTHREAVVPDTPTRILAVAPEAEPKLVPTTVTLVAPVAGILVAVAPVGRKPSKENELVTESACLHMVTARARPADEKRQSGLGRPPGPQDKRPSTVVSERQWVATVPVPPTRILNDESRWELRFAAKTVTLAEPVAGAFFLPWMCVRRRGSSYVIETVAWAYRLLPAVTANAPLQKPAGALSFMEESDTHLDDRAP
mmetsp:Transcript_20909/g.48892  ORF Transcript_20909/g.48892 Transcript_20909/m.48892 type:complete len:220 (+) Transcript_20909:8246-8905(+)